MRTTQKKSQMNQKPRDHVPEIYQSTSLLEEAESPPRKLTKKTNFQRGRFCLKLVKKSHNSFVYNSKNSDGKLGEDTASNSNVSIPGYVTIKRNRPTTPANVDGEEGGEGESRR